MTSGVDDSELLIARSDPRKDRPGRLFIVAVLAAAVLAVSASAYVFSLVPPPPTPTIYVVFADPTLSGGNASFVVLDTSGGPYRYGGFGVRLSVNNFASAEFSLGGNGSVLRVTIGPNAYQITWLDSDADGSVTMGDVFNVSGDRTPLPSLSAYEFDLQWQSTWTAKAFWTTG